MVTTLLVADDSLDFARRLRVIMANDDIGADELAKRLFNIGFMNGTRREPISAATIRRWCRCGLKERSDWLYEALAMVTSGSEEYYRGEKTVNFRPRPVAQIGWLENVGDMNDLAGEPGGARTLDTRIKSPGTKKTTASNNAKQQDFPLTAQDLFSKL